MDLCVFKYRFYPVKISNQNRLTQNKGPRSHLSPFEGHHHYKVVQDKCENLIAFHFANNLLCFKLWTNNIKDYLLLFLPSPFSQKANDQAVAEGLQSSTLLGEMLQQRVFQGNVIFLFQLAENVQITLAWY